jgi:TnpA family transposase
VHIDGLFGEAGKTSIDFDLIESQFRHLMRVAVSVREGVISSATLLKRLRSGSHKNATYTAFREVGRVIRTVRLLRCLTDTPLCRRGRPGDPAPSGCRRKGRSFLTGRCLRLVGQTSAGAGAGR